jgi:hypothetical protein
MQLREPRAVESQLIGMNDLLDGLHVTGGLGLVGCARKLKEQAKSHDKLSSGATT